MVPQGACIHLFQAHPETFLAGDATSRMTAAWGLKSIMSHRERGRFFKYTFQSFRFTQNTLFLLQALKDTDS